MQRFSFKNLGANTYFLASKMASGLMLLPFLYSYFPTEDVTKWFAYYSIFVIIQIFDTGLISVSSRFLSYSPTMFCKSTSTLLTNSNSNNRYVYNKRIISVVALVYLVLALVGSFTILLTYTFIFSKGSENGLEMSFSELRIFVLMAGFFLFSNFFVSTLNAMGYYSYVQFLRGHAQWLGFLLAAICTIFGAEVFFVALVFHGTQILAGIFLASWFYRELRGHLFESWDERDGQIFKDMRKAIGQTFLGLFLIVGVQQLTGVFVSANYPPEVAAPYFLWLQVLKAGNTFARSPVYSQLPALYPVFHENESKNLRRLLWGLALGALFYLFVAILFPVLSSSIGGLFDIDLGQINATYVFLALYFFLELIGGCLVEIVTLWGIVLWGRAAVATLLVFVIGFFILNPFLAETSIPLSLSAAYVVGFLPVTWHGARKKFESAGF